MNERNGIYERIENLVYTILNFFYCFGSGLSDSYRFFTLIITWLLPLLITWIFLTMGLATEANPLIRLLLHAGGFPLVVGFEISFIALSVIVISRLDRFRPDWFNKNLIFNSMFIVFLLNLYLDFITGLECLLWSYN